MTTPPDYHTEFTQMRPLTNEFIGMSTTQLLEDIETVSDVLAQMRGKDADVRYLEWFLERATEERERRRQRYECHRDDRFPPAWPTESDFGRWRAQAESVKDQLSIEGYLAEQVPAIEFRQSGRRLIAHCPAPDHQDRTPSFVIYEDGGAWCHGCNRGGDLFRIIGLVEGLPRFRDQLARALEFVPEATTKPHENRSLTTSHTKGPVNCESSGRGVFRPIRVVNGKVAS